MREEKQTAPRSARASDEKLLRASDEIRRSIAEGVRAVADAGIKSINGFRGRPSETRYASNVIDLADREINLLTLEREEELEQVRAQGGLR